MATTDQQLLEDVRERLEADESVSSDQLALAIGLGGASLTVDLTQAGSETRLRIAALALSGGSSFAIIREAMALPMRKLDDAQKAIVQFVQIIFTLMGTPMLEVLTKVADVLNRDAEKGMMLRELLSIQKDTLEFQLVLRVFGIGRRAGQDRMSWRRLRGWLFDQLQKPEALRFVDAFERPDDGPTVVTPTTAGTAAASPTMPTTPTATGATGASSPAAPSGPAAPVTPAAPVSPATPTTPPGPDPAPAAAPASQPDPDDWDDIDA